jgi:predicted negative regulator of RcsB-dependent stress response
MGELNNLPEWIGSGIFTLIGAILGGALKILWDWWQARKAEIEKQRAWERELSELQSKARATEVEQFL